MLDFHAPGALEAGDGQGRMETHRWARGASLGWGDGDWEAVQRQMEAPVWVLGKVEQTETWSGQTLS